MLVRFPIIVQFLRFGLVGTSGFVMDSAVLLAMLALGVGPYAGRVASYLAAASLTFALNRAWTFRSAARAPVARQWGRFVLLNLLGFPPILDLVGRWIGTEGIEVMAGFSVLSHFDGFQKGVLDSRDVIYFVSISGFSLFATGVVLRGHRAG